MLAVGRGARSTGSTLVLLTAMRVGNQSRINTVQSSSRNRSPERAAAERVEA